MEAVIVVKAHRGAKRDNVIVGEYPIVTVRIGKYDLKPSPPASLARVTPKGCRHGISFEVCATYPTTMSSSRQQPS